LLLPYYRSVANFVFSLLHLPLLFLYYCLLNCKAVEESCQLDMYRLYIKKAESFFGVTRTREIHEQAIKNLSDKDAQVMSLDYAQLERRLGEVDRARAIFSHGAQFENPKRAPDYWKQWHDFEVSHGNEDTFRDMLRVKRSVMTAFANETFYDMASSEVPVQSDAEVLSRNASKHHHNKDAMSAIEAQVTQQGGSNVSGFVASSSSSKRKAEDELEALERQAKAIRQAAETSASDPAAVSIENPEEIDLDDDEEEEEEDTSAVSVSAKTSIAQRAVPAAVFGDLAAKYAAEKE
jgi:pre-mRNA-splicing factor SYF1